MAPASRSLPGKALADTLLPTPEALPPPPRTKPRPGQTTPALHSGVSPLPHFPSTPCPWTDLPVLGTHTATLTPVWGWHARPRDKAAGHPAARARAQCPPLSSAGPHGVRTGASVPQRPLAQDRTMQQGGGVGRPLPPASCPAPAGATWGQGARCSSQAHPPASLPRPPRPPPAPAAQMGSSSALPLLDLLTSSSSGPGTGAGWVPLLGAAQALCEHLPPAESTCWVLGPSWVLQREQHRVVCWVRAQVLGGDRCPLPTASSPACGAQPLWCLGDDAPRSPGLLQHLISGVPDCPQGSPTLPTPWVKPRHLKCPAWFRLGWVGQGRALRGGGLRGGLRGPVGASQAREWAGLGKATPELQREVCASTGWRTGL